MLKKYQMLPQIKGGTFGSRGLKNTNEENGWLK